MNRIVIALVIVTFVGCSSTIEPNPEPKANLFSLVIEGKTGRWKTQPIPQTEAELLRGIIASPPDQVLSMPLPLLHTCVVEIEGTRYALEPGELIRGNTHRWKSTGIKKRILDAVKKE